MHADPEFSRRLAWRRVRRLAGGPDIWSGRAGPASHHWRASRVRPRARALDRREDRAAECEDPRRAPGRRALQRPRRALHAEGGLAPRARRLHPRGAGPAADGGLPSQPRPGLPAARGSRAGRGRIRDLQEPRHERRPRRMAPDRARARARRRPGRRAGGVRRGPRGARPPAGGRGHAAGRGQGARPAGGRQGRGTAAIAGVVSARGPGVSPHGGGRRSAGGGGRHRGRGDRTQPGGDVSRERQDPRGVGLAGRGRRALRQDLRTGPGTGRPAAAPGGRAPRGRQRGRRAGGGGPRAAEAPGRHRHLDRQRQDRRAGGRAGRCRHRLSPRLRDRSRHARPEHGHRQPLHEARPLGGGPGIPGAGHRRPEHATRGGLQLRGQPDAGEEVPGGAAVVAARGARAARLRAGLGGARPGPARQRSVRRGHRALPEGAGTRAGRARGLQPGRGRLARRTPGRRPDGLRAGRGPGSRLRRSLVQLRPRAHEGRAQRGRARGPHDGADAGARELPDLPEPGRGALQAEALPGGHRQVQPRARAEGDGRGVRQHGPRLPGSRQQGAGADAVQGSQGAAGRAMTTAGVRQPILSSAGALLVALLLLTPVAGAAGAAPPLAQHPSQLAPLTPASTFPRFTADQLAAAGFPDHLHACRQPSWQPLVDASGTTYGPYSLARGAEIQPRSGLVIAPGAIGYRGIHLVHEPQFAATLVLPFVELLDWARRDLPPLLGHDRADTLRVRDPGTLEAYVAATGQNFWRLHAWRDGECVIEPAATLASRTLDAHAAFAVVAEWLLDDAAGAGNAFPAWFRAGLGSYFAEYGVHLVNYAAEFRAAGLPVVLAAARTDSLLAAPPAADPELDRHLYRTASYSAFVMVWRLVEDHGGPTPLRAWSARPPAAPRPTPPAAPPTAWTWADSPPQSTRRPARNPSATPCSRARPTCRRPAGAAPERHQRR